MGRLLSKDNEVDNDDVTRLPTKTSRGIFEFLCSRRKFSVRVDLDLFSRFLNFVQFYKSAFITNRIYLTQRGFSDRMLTMVYFIHYPPPPSLFRSRLQEEHRGKT